MNNKWVYNVDGSEIWTSGFYESKEDCIFEAIEEALDKGVPGFSIGIAESVGCLAIDGQDIIERLQEDMHELVGEVSETYLEEATKDDIEDLGNRLTKVFYDWCKENKIDNGESYYTLGHEEEIQYCAYCKKVIENEEDSSELIKVPGEYIEEYYFHKDCDYVPITHLVPDEYFSNGRVEE
ncbi:hypothetical protein LEQ06_08120 [Paraclostridium sp. AKS46]|nr:hypothetical protein [Paraclostridium sp. AKS46]